MDKLTVSHNPARAERRTGEDRRRRDVGPPGRHERRRGLEARKPEVVELEISESEWEALTQATMPMPLR
jgi:hypothetical protein